MLPIELDLNHISRIFGVQLRGLPLELRKRGEGLCYKARLRRR